MLELSPVLAVWAHPDDESFVSAGLMQSIITAGGRVIVAHATRGEAGSQDPERWPPQKMGELREGELAEALSILGVKDHHWPTTSTDGAKRLTTPRQLPRSLRSSPTCNREP